MEPSSSSVVLNRVTGGLGPSEILGHAARPTAASSSSIATASCLDRAEGAPDAAVLEFEDDVIYWPTLLEAQAALLFIDSLDLFTADERRTVVDIVRDAADIPNLAYSDDGATKLRR